MKQWFLFTLIILGLPSTVLAQSVTVTSPSSGECLKGGASKTVTWAENGNNHFALFFRTDGIQPSYTGNSGGMFAHNFGSQTSYSWTVDSVTTSAGKIWAEGHNIDHTQSSINSSGTFSIDSSAPSAPSNLSSPSKTTSSISLSWSGSSDDGCKGLEGYKIFRNNSEIASLGSSSSSYTDSNLSPGTTYSYKIRAYDSFHSTDSGTLSVATNASSGGNGTTSGSTPTPTPQTSSTSGSNAGAGTATPTTATQSSGTSPTTSATQTTTATTLETLAIDGRELALNTNDTPIVAVGQTISLAGRTTPNAVVEITLYSEPKTSQANSDSQGYWSHILETAEVDPGDHRIEVVTKDTSGNVIAPAKEILKFSVVPAEQKAMALASQEKLQRRSPIVWILVGILLLLAGIAGVIIYIKKKKTTPPPSIPTASPSS